MAVDLSGYVPVADRLAKLFADHPDAYLRPLDLRRPYWIEEIGGATFLVYAAACYYDAADKCPGIGMAWEPFPGKTPYTRDSELQNAETSAWGRAIVAKGAADTGAGIASRDEVQARDQSETGERLASENQIRALERGIEERGLPEGVPFPIPFDPRPTMREASGWLDLVNAQPRESPPPERVSTLRADRETPRADQPAETRPEEAPVEGVRPWNRRPVPYDAGGEAIERYWRTILAAIPGIGPARFLAQAREIAVELGRPVPADLATVDDPELVNAVRLWMDARADEKGIV